MNFDLLMLAAKKDARARLFQEKRQEERERRARRDMFAAAALTGILAARHWELGSYETDAVKFADAVIAELDKEEGK